jgi:hypothetical protein
VIRFTSALAAILALSACSKPAPQPRDGAPLDAVRVAMPVNEPMPGPLDHAAKPQWAASPDGSEARFGNAGQGPMLSIGCRSGVLLVTRHIPAEVGAQALFALIGSDRILRLPVDATAIAGVRGYLWQGTLAPDDPGAQVFMGSFEGTLPGGGKISVSGGDALREVLRRCRANPATAAPAAPAAQD